MAALWSLNPYFWKYRWHFIAGIAFVALTNVFAVYAPALIGEGVNALQDLETEYLAPLRNGDDAVFQTPHAVRTPATLHRISLWWQRIAPPLRRKRATRVRSKT